MGDRAEGLEALEEVIRRISRRYRQRMGEDGLTFGQFALMRILSQGGPMAMGEVAHALGVSLAGATGLIDRLVHADMVRRTRSESDRRVVWVDLSEHGQLEFERLHAQRNEYLGRMFKPLDEARLGQLLEILETIDRGLDGD